MKFWLICTFSGSADNLRVCAHLIGFRIDKLAILKYCIQFFQNNTDRIVIMQNYLLPLSNRLNKLQRSTRHVCFQSKVTFGETFGFIKPVGRATAFSTTQNKTSECTWERLYYFDIRKFIEIKNRNVENYIFAENY